jgi:putative intracellular protease/amidase
MQPRTVHLFVFDTFADWEPAYAVGVLNSPPAPPLRAYQVRTVGVGAKPIRSAGGLAVVPGSPIAEVTPASSSLLILPGGAGWEKGEHGEAVAKAREFLAAGVPVAAICGATFGLARNGLLDERRHTSNAPEYLGASGYRGSESYQVQRAVTDGPLITAGAAGALEFAHHIFLKLELYSPKVLESWYQLYRTGEARHYFDMMQAMSSGAPAAPHAN